MPQYKPVIFAHVFSGRRRHGDFQEQVEQRGARAISIDIIFHVTYGDLCRPQTYDLFRRAFFEDVIWGFLGGPPWETWSRARGRVPEGQAAGPRVLFDRLAGPPEDWISRPRKTGKFASGAACWGLL